MILEYFCVFTFAIYIFHKWHIAPDGCFWRDKKHVILTGTIIVSRLIEAYGNIL